MAKTITIDLDVFKKIMNIVCRFQRKERVISDTTILMLLNNIKEAEGK